MNNPGVHALVEWANNDNAMFWDELDVVEEHPVDVSAEAEADADVLIVDEVEPEVADPWIDEFPWLQPGPGPATGAPMSTYPVLPVDVVAAGVVSFFFF